jgi:hypothetical protein
MHRRLRHARRTRTSARTHARTHARRAHNHADGGPDGCRYWFNKKSGEASWTRPDEQVALLSAHRRGLWLCFGQLCCFALNEMSTAGDALPVALTQWGGLQRHVPFADRMGPCDRTRREMPLVRNAPIPCNNMPHHATNSMREHPPSNVQEAPTPWLRRGGAAASNATRTCTCAMHRNARVRPTEYVLHATEQLYGTPSTLTAPMGALSTQHSDAS